MRVRLPDQALAIAAAATLSSCVGNGGTTQIPLGNWETEAALVASPTTATPEHALSKIEYPFDAEGNYIAAWAAGNVESIEVEPTNLVAASAPASGPGPVETPPLAQLTDTRKPPAAAGAPVIAAPAPPPEATPGSRYHKVSGSDTLWGLSRKYGTTVSAIQRANGLSDTTIRTGSTIKIPG